MKKKLFDLGIPHYITIETEGGGCISKGTAQAFCREMCIDPILHPYPVYGSNNWYYAYGDSSEKEILQDTEYLMELTREAKNPPYMVSDDCWQEHNRLNEYNGGPWRKGNNTLKYFAYIPLS